MLLFHSILTFMKDLYQSENQVFNPTRLLVLPHCWVGKDWAGPFFPPSKIFRSFYWSVSLSVYVTLSLYLNTYELPIPKRESSFKPNILFVLLHCEVGKDWAGRSFPPPPPPPSKMFWSFYLSFCLSVNVILLLYLKSEDLWMTHSKEIIKFSNQKVYWLSPSNVFQPLYFILVNWFFQIVGWGKTGPIFL